MDAKQTSTQQAWLPFLGALLFIQEMVSATSIKEPKSLL